VTEPATLARPYARAAFAHALEHDELPAWSRLLQFLAVAVTEPAVKAMVSAPGERADRRAEKLLRLCDEALPANEGGRHFLQLLARSRRLGLLPAIATAYQRQLDRHHHHVQLEIISPLKVSKAQHEQLATAMEKRLDRQIRASVHEDPRLLGGVRVQAGDLVLDGSLQRRVERLVRAIRG